VTRPVDRLARGVATVAGLGDVAPAPGTTAGALPAAIAWWVLARVVADPPGQFAALAVATVVASVVGAWAAGHEARRRARHDPRAVVVDEVAGQWLCVLVTGAFVGASGAGSLLAVSLGFVAFRVFDVVKPWPIRRLERLPGGLGIMVDDLAAGIAAGCVVGLTLRLL
jgi:phosphatidylglycerophosphatase A